MRFLGSVAIITIIITLLTEHIITVGHRSFTEQSVHMTVHTATWSDKMTGSSRSS